MTSNTNTAKNHEIAAAVAGALVVTLGVSVIYGWFAGNRAIIQVFPQLAPMQFNTALAFLVSGAGLLGIVYRAPYLSLGAGVFLIALGIATLVQYFSGVSLGIDQLFMQREIAVQTSHPGRMAPNTALCFALTGAIFSINAVRLREPTVTTIQRAFILFSAALSIVALIGYVSRVEAAYGWTDLTSMALHTAVGMTVLNAGLFLTTLRPQGGQIGINASNGWIAFVGVAVTMIAALSLAFEVEKNETNAIRSKLVQEAAFIKTALESALGVRFLDLRRVAQRWEFLEGAPQDEWRKEALHFLGAHKDLLAVGYTDVAFNVQWVDRLHSDMPVQKAEHLIDANSAKLRARAQMQTEEGGRAPIGFVSNEGWFVAFLPMYLDGRAQGFSVGVFAVDTLVTAEVSKTYFTRHAVAIRRNGALIFESGGQYDQIAARWGVTDFLDFFEIEWSLAVWPKREFLNQQRTPLRFVTVGVGFLFSAILLLMYRSGVAERQRATERANAAAFLETVLNTVSDGILACDRNGEISVFNRAAKRLYGGDTVSHHPESGNLVAGRREKESDPDCLEDDAPLLRALDGECLVDEEALVTNGGVAPRMVIVNASPLIGAKGASIGAVATMRDVTDERAALEDARRREAELKLIFDNVPVRLWLKDDKNRILRINKQAAESMGVSVEAAEGANAYDLIPESAKKYHEDDLKVLDSGEPALGVVEEFNPKRGGRAWVSSDKAPYIDEQTGERLLFVASTDITKLVEASEELQRSNAALEQFARVASHDLQEPLRKLMIYTGFLEADLGDELSEKVKADLDTISKSAERMRALVRDMLSLSRIRADGITVSPVDPQKCLSAAMASLSERCREVGAVIVYDDLPPVMAEQTMLTQVYLNLAGNALKFASPDRTPSIKFGASASGEKVVLSVEDNGIGVAPEYFDKIFEPLMRVHSRDAYDGTGIGLSVCKKTIESLGGKIWVEPAPECGVVFKFSLNRAAAMESATRKSA